ncbi:hypothetical protein DL96DRAFT_1468768 [Flagelloscypha sp. PMI_526]|nr:hypothetical protein DL96DRAFT_1468768 [Flagelloscypha sp. PMI_526]
MKLFVKTLTGKTVTVFAEDSNSIRQLKLQIQDLEGIPPKEEHGSPAGLSWVVPYPPPLIPLPSRVRLDTLSLGTAVHPMLPLFLAHST